MNGDAKDVCEGNGKDTQIQLKVKSGWNSLTEDAADGITPGRVVRGVI